MKAITVKQLLSAPEIELRKLWDVRELIDTVEVNDWHVHQSVWNHTLEVLSALARVRSLSIEYLDTLEPYFPLFSEYLDSKPFKGSTRMDLLGVAALLHDLGKPSTVKSDDQGNTTCPNHAERSHELARGILQNIDISDHEVAYIQSVVSYHHNPDSFLDSAQSDLYGEKLNDFIKMAGTMAVDILVFYLADFEGCATSEEVNETKQTIYPLVCGIILDILDVRAKG